MRPASEKKAYNHHKRGETKEEVYPVMQSPEVNIRNPSLKRHCVAPAHF
jgi:hypothetical protein